MNFQGKTGSELKRGRQVRVRVGDEDLGICIFDEPTAHGNDAIWISFPRTAPRRLPPDNDTTEFTVLAPETRFG